MLSVSLLMYMLASLYMYNFMFTENYWEAVYLSKVKGSGMANDQIRLNYGLHKMDIKWEKSGQEN